ncbi:hypothetical protein [Halobellus rubicundus]|uniref:Uncharacterized protein n=1 Tax=Halobellus rubicundus TaxID=2996466 RepID=A0ABD5M9J7_9EURY
MRRRTVLAGAAASLPLLAGCTGSANDGSEPTTDESATATDEPSRTADDADLVSGTLVPREECPTAGDATVELGDGSATVRGCVVGKNGCTVPSLREVTIDAETDVATVVVAAVEERGEDEACTEALVNLGYEVRVDAGDATLTGVEVVHDDIEGRRVVTDVTR